MPTARPTRSRRTPSTHPTTGSTSSIQLLSASRTEYQMKSLAVAAAGAAVAALAACSQAAAPAAAPAGPATVKPPVSCGQQYRSWAHGQGKGLMAAFDAVSSAETAGNARLLTVALKKAKPTVARAARHPVPACADPRGYWSVLVMHVNAAAASTK